MSFTSEHVLDGVPLGIVVTDLEGRILAANARMLDMLGCRLETLHGSALVDVTVESSVRADTEALAALAAGRRPDPYIKEFVTRDLMPVPVEVHIGPLYNEAGKVAYAVFAAKALSEEMKLLQDLQRRNMHLLASSEVSRAATQILDIQEVLTRCVDLIRTHFGFYYAAIFLMDEAGEWAILRAATGEAGRRLLDAGHKLGVGSASMVGWVTANNTARIALDVGDEPIRFNNPELPKTRSEIALPLRVRGQVIGALDAQSTEVNAFSGEDIQTIQMMADQVAIAIDNARLFSERG